MRSFVGLNAFLKQKTKNIPHHSAGRTVFTAPLEGTNGCVRRGNGTRRQQVHVNKQADVSENRK